MINMALVIKDEKLKNDDFIYSLSEKFLIQIMEHTDAAILEKINEYCKEKGVIPYIIDEKDLKMVIELGIAEMEKRKNKSNLRFVCTCEACPEQYDVYDGDKKVAYVRLRYGALNAYPYVDDEISWCSLYTKTYGDKYKGSFDDEMERNEELDHISSIIRHYLEEMR